MVEMCELTISEPLVYRVYVQRNNILFGLLDMCKLSISEPLVYRVYVRSAITFYLARLTRPFSIAHSLLGGKSHHKTHVEAQLLTPAQEEVLVEWIKVRVLYTHPRVSMESMKTLWSPQR